MRLGQPVFMRIFKLSRELEVWLLNRGEDVAPDMQLRISSAFSSDAASG